MSKTLWLAALLVLPATLARADEPEDAIGDPAAATPADKPMIRAAVKRSIPQIEYCYERQLLVDPTLQGTVRATFTIGADGKVTASTATGVNDAVAKCVATVISGIPFEKPRAGVTVVKYPFVFRAEGAPPPPPTSKGGDDDRVMIRRHVKREIQKIEYCYEKQLLAQPTLAGTVTVKFTIGADGKVVSATASGLAAVDACVAGVIKTIAFDRPSAGLTEVNYPFVFKPDTSPGAAPAEVDPDKLMIRRAIRRHILPIQYCYEKRLLEQPGLAGTVTVKFTIQPDGKVSSSTATGLDTAVASCVAGVVKTIAFDKPSKKLEINYPFVFRAAD